MKILVSGGAGFIGSHVVDKLVSKGHSVTVLDNLSSGSNENIAHATASANAKNIDFTLIQDDITRAALWGELPAFDAFFHFAAQTSVTASAKNPEFDWAQNIGPIPYIFSWIQRHKVKYLLYSNTAGAFYGDTLQLPTLESTAPNPRSSYGATKSFFEIYLNARTLTLYDLGERSPDPKSENYFSWSSLRLANVYGPRQTIKGEAGVVPIFFHQMRTQQQPVVYGDGNKTRDYVYVDDVAEAFLLSFEKLQNSPLNQSYNIATGKEIRDSEVFHCVANELASLLKADSTQTELISFLKTLEPKYENTRAGELLRSQLNPSKAFDAFAWKSKMNFSDGLRKTLSAMATKSIW